MSAIRLLRNNPEEFCYIAGEIARTPVLAMRRQRLKARGERPIGYIGWLGHRNLGDEAMYLVVARMLSEFPVIPFVAEPGERFLARLGLGGPGYFRAVLLGGGTLINPHYLRSAVLAKSFGAALCTVGTGVGSPGFGTSPHPPIDEWRELLRDADFLGVRGPLSGRQLEAAVIGKPMVIGDPALGLTRDSAPLFRSRNRLVISLAQEVGQKPSAAESAILLELRRIANDWVAKGGELVGIALGNGDYRALAKFRAAAGIRNMRMEIHRKNPERLLQTLEGSVGLIGVRLHSAVFACCVGVPPVLLAYRSKCEDFMETMGLRDFAVPICEESGPRLLRAKWREVLSRPDLGSQIYQKALSWKRVQKAYFERLSNWIRTDCG